MFHNAYRWRRALLPIDGFFEWKDIFSTGKNKQPYAIAMKDGSPFALAALWEIWRDPSTGEDIRTFALLTCPPNAMMATIHDRMPVILHEKDYWRWLGDEPDPRDLLVPFPAERMTMWPIGTKVGSPNNDTADILDLIHEKRGAREAQGSVRPVSGYDKSPDYGGSKPGRWTVAIWLIAVLAAAATVALIFN